MKKLTIAYRFRNLKHIVMTADERVFQLPFKAKGYSHATREIIPKELKGKLYYRINRDRYSLKKLHELCYESAETLDVNDPSADTNPLVKKIKKEKKK